MNKTNNLPLTLAVVGLIVASSFGIIFGGKEVTTTTIDTSDRSTVERVESPQTVEEPVGGLVEVFRKVFPEGFVIGNNESENIFHTDSSNVLYIGATSSDSDYAPIVIDIGADTPLTIRNVNFATSSLNWAADFSVDRIFYVDQSADGVGFGTTTPAYMVELANGANTILAITATSTNDAILQMNIGYTGLTRSWFMYVDNSDDDKLKIATSTVAGEIDILTIDAFGQLTLNGTSTFAGKMTLTGAFVQSGGAVDLATTTITGPVYSGGNTLQVYASSSSPTATGNQMCSSSLMMWTGDLDVDSDVFYLASSTDIIDSCLKNAGDWWQFTLRNNATGTLVMDIRVPDVDDVNWDTDWSGHIELLKSGATGGNVLLAAGESAIIRLQNVDGSTTTVSVLDLVRP